MVKLCSDWCLHQWNYATHNGDSKSANDYYLLYEHWKSKGM